MINLTLNFRKIVIIEKRLNSLNNYKNNEKVGKAENFHPYSQIIQKFNNQISSKSK